jgi:hypothetical protein
VTVSFKVAIVCEDPTYDRYIAEPVIAKACEEIGRPRAQLRTVEWPRVYGVSQLKDAVCDYLHKWGPISDAVVFVVDADGEDGTDGRPDRARQFASAITACGEALPCHVLTVALQELEVWALWGCYQQLGVSWDVVRSEPHPKERFFDPQVTKAELRTADRGRTRMIEASLSKGWHSLVVACPEIGALTAGLRQCL